MFAMLITPDNLPKIKSRISFTESESNLVDTYLSRNEKWVAITGFTSVRGQFFDWVIFPMYIVDCRFEYDADKIKTDWDQIVRK